MMDENARREYEIPPGAIERAEQHAAAEKGARRREQQNRSVLALEADGETVCRSCSVPLVWAVTPDGAAVPIERAPDAGGTVGISPDGGWLFGLPRVPDGQLSLTEERPVRYRLHFETCPDREKWRAWGFRRRQAELKGGHE